MCNDFDFRYAVDPLFIYISFDCLHFDNFENVIDLYRTHIALELNLPR